jgi:hypothetical protein
MIILRGLRPPARQLASGIGKPALLAAQVDLQFRLQFPAPRGD